MLLILFVFLGYLRKFRHSRGCRVLRQPDGASQCLLGSFVLVQAITYGPAGTAIYEWATEDSRGAAIPPLGFQPQEGRLMTGRS